MLIIQQKKHAVESKKQQPKQAKRQQSCKIRSHETASIAGKNTETNPMHRECCLMAVFYFDVPASFFNFLALFKVKQL